MNTDRLQSIKDIIEEMNKYQQIEILKILIKNSISVSENNNGIFINLSDLSGDIIDELEKYIEFINKQDNQLLNIETEKNNIKNEFFKHEKRNVKLKTNKE